MATYTAVSTVDLPLWSSGVPQGPFAQINIDVRIKNLFAYADAIGGATTSFMDNLSFTVITP